MASNICLGIQFSSFEICLLSVGKALNVFFTGSKITPWEHRAYGIIFFVPFHTSPMVTSSRGSSSRHLGPLGEKGEGDTTDPWWGIEERGSARIERSQESTACSQLWTPPFQPQNWSLSSLFISLFPVSQFFFSFSPKQVQIHWSYSLFMSECSEVPRESKTILCWSFF